MFPRVCLCALLTGCVLSKDSYDQRLEELERDPTATPRPTLVDCFTDGDGDGFGAGPAIPTPSCEAGTVDVAGDCDDARPTTNPGAAEVCGNEVDEDCDGTDEPAVTSYVDGDNDGFGAEEIIACASEGVEDGGDCDDTDATSYPGATETPADGIDSNCDGVDLCFEDLDGDGRGTSQTIEGQLDCADAAQSLFDDDCDDTDPTVSPTLPELCGGGDENCDPADDIASLSFFTDGDGDSFGAGGEVQECIAPPGYVDNDDDCDDTDAAVNPNGVLVSGNQVDENCDGLAECHVDGDGDTFGTGPAVAGTSDTCTDFADNDLDCDDDRDEVNPTADEIAGNDVDEDCDGTLLCFQDQDGDGWGGENVELSESGCQQDGVAEVDGDCDDADPSTHPGAVDVPNGIDEDCDGLFTCQVDLDGDSFAGAELSDQPAPCAALPDGDCNDNDTSIHPAAEEYCDGVDQDCDGDENAGLVTLDDENIDTLQAAVDAAPLNATILVCGGPGETGQHPLRAAYPQSATVAGIAVGGELPVLIRSVDDPLLLTDNGYTFQNLILDGGGIPVENDGACVAMADGVLTLEAVTVRNCISGGTGGGVHLSIAASIVFDDCIFENNEAAGNGGAIDCEGCEGVTGSSSVIRANTALSGGGISIDSSLLGAVLNEVAFEENTASGGAGLNLFNSPITLTGGRFESNTASGIGGGLLVFNALGEATSTTFRTNSAAAGSAVEILAGDFNLNDVLVEEHLQGALHLSGTANLVQLDQCDFQSNGFGAEISAGTLISLASSWSESPIQTTDAGAYTPALADFTCTSAGCEEN